MNDTQRITTDDLLNDLVYAGTTSEHGIADFREAARRDGWGEAFTYMQVAFFHSGFRDGRLHDTTLSCLTS